MDAAETTGSPRSIPISIQNREESDDSDQPLSFSSRRRDEHEDEEEEDEGERTHRSLGIKLGMEDSDEQLDELQFSLAHSDAANREDIANELQRVALSRLEEEESRPQIVSGRIRKESLSANNQQLAASLGLTDNYEERLFEKYIHQEEVEYLRKSSLEHRDSVSKPGTSFNNGPGSYRPILEDNISDLLVIQRVDSGDVVFEHKPKRAKILSNYIMGDVLGEGSYAKVKEAVDQRTLKRRAVKIVKKKNLRKIPRGEENVKREIQILSKLNHKNVMRQIEVFYNDEKGKVYIVLEYCTAVLKDMLEKSETGKFPTWQAHYYFNQLVDGLAYLHSNRIIHKDIKPGNLLLDASGTLKICDFGVSEVLDLFAADDTIKTSQGTPTFQPPEIANGAEKLSGFKIDVWSAGVTLFNFVTGSYPFDGETVFKLFENIGNGDFEIPNYIEPVLASLIRGMLTKDPEERFSLAQVKSNDWCRKRHPCNVPPVTVKPKDDEDPAISTSVIPYLFDLHKDFYEEDAEENQEDLHSDHEENGNGVQISSTGLAATSSRGAHIGETQPPGTPSPKEKKSRPAKEVLASPAASDGKTTKCIKVRKLGNCSIS